jgi:hypothetical protein
MALGETKASMEEMILRVLESEGPGALDAPTARRVASAIAEALDENNHAIEMKLTQKLQTAGLHV